MPGQVPNQFKPGDMLGPYRVDSLIGKGGMGEVYRGTDTRLGRPVALKVSARQFSDRFEREAKAISSLNHANICTLYDVGQNYLVLEFVEGDTLAHAIKQGPMPLEKFVRQFYALPLKSKRLICLLMRYQWDRGSAVAVSKTQGLAD